MLYLGIDQDRKQITVNLRPQEGDVILRRQVSAEWRRIKAFPEQVRKDAASQGGLVAILEVCGFNDWLLEMLDGYGGPQAVLVQPEKRSKKTGWRDTSARRARAQRHSTHRAASQAASGMSHQGPANQSGPQVARPMIAGRGRPTGDETAACPKGICGTSK